MCSKALQIQSTAAPYVYKLCKSDVLCTLLFTVVNCMYSLYSCWISAIHVCPVTVQGSRIRLVRGLVKFVPAH